jgi:16S rRNA (cytosine1402-N4)-methyltransferase
MKNQTSSLESSHFPVMLDEVVQICSPGNGGVFIDCTFGGGGYSKRLLKFPKTNVIALDRDKFTLNIAKDLKKKIKIDSLFIRKNLAK